MHDVLNTDTAGNVLRSLTLTEATGFAIDQTNNIIYVGAYNNFGPITPYNLTTLVPGTPWLSNPLTAGGEDMTFDGTYIWRAGPSSSIDKIDPAAPHNVITSLDLSSSFSFQTLGVAWDGTGLWVSEIGYGNPASNSGLVKKLNTDGTPAGPEFYVDSDIFAGGLAYDPRDGTLYVGSYNAVYHYSTTGQLLTGSFATPDIRYVDGLEFQSAAGSVPPSLLLLGSGLLSLLAMRRKFT